MIPGSVGAAAVQNIGAYGVELADRIHSVTAYDTVLAREVVLTPPPSFTTVVVRVSSRSRMPKAAMWSSRSR